ncbi:oxaloacetate decarboxylase subunit beta, partial [Salmonella enterica subsp. enterica serovar Newport str. SHSN002]
MVVFFFFFFFFFCLFFLAVIAAKLNCAPDVHAIKEALALALPSVQSQMENLAVDMGYTPGVLALFYK